MSEFEAQRKEQLYANLAQSLTYLNHNLQTLRANLEVTKQQTTAIQKLTLCHSSLFIGSGNTLGQDHGAEAPQACSKEEL
ncbi:hypothetical protein IWQ60_011758 [Tieghemiomyces parasiticus]|uniref:Uncharacterized protein n=1 Tax=Tieghemiomyces parasiticus TaxID=78921 RepID=A0A9W7ZND3_9FUNG|nr:hypothetical protein IWQ60_011758 [Tieghemiomyces parasiticus]